MHVMRPVFVLPLVAVIGLAGCADMGTRQTAGTVTGAAVGGVLGAAIPGNRVATGAVGAVGGALVGGLIGSQLDKQAGELRQSFGNDRIQVINTGTSLRVVMPDDILFATDSSSLNPTLRADLRALSSHLQRYPNSTVQVIGHTDNTGDSNYNLRLSQARAQSVTNVLLRNGVGGARLQAIGRGDSQPVATNLTPEGRAQNRRVEVIILPNG